MQESLEAVKRKRLMPLAVALKTPSVHEALLLSMTPFWRFSPQFLSHVHVLIRSEGEVTSVTQNNDN